MKRYLCLADFEAPARRKLPRSVYGFINGSAEDGATLRANLEAFDHVRFEPRVLIDTSTRSSRVITLGEEWSAPFGIAPMGAMGVAVYQADLLMARAAAKANIPFILSGASLYSMERVAAENSRTWFQAYLSSDRAENSRLIERVEHCGFNTLVITVDVPVGGNRETDIRHGYSSPLRPSLRLTLDGLTHPRWLLGTFLKTLIREGMPHFDNFATPRTPMLSRTAMRPHQRDQLCWDDVQRLRERWKGNLVIKGVLSAHDVRLARAAGFDGVIASNHGGRQLDGAVSPMEVLSAMKAESGTLALMCDSGFRRGSHILKGMSLGASHVFLGRPFLYAAVAGGEAGVLRAIELLQAEIMRNMALLGWSTPYGEGHPPLAENPRGENPENSATAAQRRLTSVS